MVLSLFHDTLSELLWRIMSAFRLLLCLTGLAIYLVFKQFILARPGVEAPVRGAGHASGHELTTPQRNSPQSISQPGSAPGTKSLKPQTNPHSEWLKSERGLVAIRADGDGDGGSVRSC